MAKNALILTKTEKMVIDGIIANGQYVWDSVKYPNYEPTLKNLMWKEYIQRKKDAGLSANVFIAGWFFSLLIRVMPTKEEEDADFEFDNNFYVEPDIDEENEE